MVTSFSELNLLYPCKFKLLRNFYKFCQSIKNSEKPCLTTDPPNFGPKL